MKRRKARAIKHYDHTTPVTLAPRITDAVSATYGVYATYGAVVVLCTRPKELSQGDFVIPAKAFSFKCSKKPAQKCSSSVYAEKLLRKKQIIPALVSFCTLQKALKTRAE